MPGAGRPSAKSRRLRRSLAKAKREADSLQILGPLLASIPPAWTAMFRDKFVPRLNAMHPATRLCLECWKPLGFERHGRRKFCSTACANAARARARRSRLRARNQQSRQRRAGMVSFDENRDSISDAISDAMFDEFDSDRLITLIATLCERNGERRRATELRKLLGDDSRSASR